MKHFNFCLVFISLAFFIVSASASPQIYLGSYHDNNRLLLNFNGTFVDDRGNTVTQIDTPTIDTVNYKLGNASGYFGGSAALTVPKEVGNFGFSDFTLLTYAKRDTTGVVQTFLDQSDATELGTCFGFGLDSDNKPRTWIYNGTSLYMAKSGIAINDALFHKYVSARNASYLSLTVDDIEVANVLISGAGTNVVNSPVGIARFGGYNGFYLTGNEDSVAIWNTYIPPSDLLNINLYEVESTIPPIATFTVTPSAGFSPLSVQFTETSTSSGTSWIWNATPITTGIPFTLNTTSDSPIYVFNNPGNYSISLKSTNAGGSNTSTQITFVNVSTEQPVASFTENKTAGTSPLAIEFIDTSINDPNIWVWTVDGTEIQNSSVIKNFTHTFYTVGTHMANLTVWNTSIVTTPSTASQSIIVYPTTYSNFTISNIKPIIFENTVTFTPIGPLIANQYLWNFGDGDIYLDYTGSAVTHKYVTASSNTTLYPSLTTYSNSNTTNTTTLTIFPLLNASYLEAGFTGSPTSGSTGLNVLFTDASYSGNGSVGLVCNWSFGDDLYSIMPYSNICGDVNHVYGYLGTYTVKLTLTNALNTSTLTRLNYITIANNQQTQTTFYSPHDVSFYITDANGQKLDGVNISVNVIESTLPGGISGALDSLVNSYGIPRSQAMIMLDPLIHMNGTTDSSGSVTVLLLSSSGYNFVITDNSGGTYTTRIYPKDNYYTIRTSGSTYTQPQNVVSNYNSNSYDVLNITEPDIYHIKMQLFYYNSRATTNYVNFWVKCVDNDTIIYWDNQTPSNHMGPVLSNYTIDNIRGEQWRWGYYDNT